MNQITNLIVIEEFPTQIDEFLSFENPKDTRIFEGLEIYGFTMNQYPLIQGLITSPISSQVVVTVSYWFNYC